MICVSLREPSYQRFIRALEGLEMAEIRMDGAELTLHQVRSLFSRPLPLVAAFRPGKADAQERIKKLAQAVRSGARYVDLELESPPGLRKGLIKTAKSSGCRVILSYHNDRETPDRSFLEEIADRCYADGADIAKIACRVHSRKDCARLISLYDRSRPIIAIGMGRLGTLTRIAAPFLGAPFTYAALTSGRRTAEGQLDWKTMQGKMRALGR